MEARSQISVRQWLQHLFTYGLGVISLSVLSFLLIPMYTRRIPPSQYGVLELLNRGLEVLTLVVMSGLGLALVAFYQFESGDIQKRKRVFPTALLITIANAVVMWILLLPLAGRISRWLFLSEDYDWAVQIFLIVVPFEVAWGLGLSVLQVQFRSRMYVGLLQVRFWLALALNFVLVVWFNQGLRGILVATLLYTTITSVLIVVMALRGTGVAFDWSLCKQMLVYGLPFVPTSFFGFILNSGDRYFLNTFADQHAVGIYALSYKLAGIASGVVLAPFVKVWGAMNVELGNRPDGGVQIARAATYISLGYLYFGLLISLLTPALLRWLSSPAYWDADAAVPVIVLAYWFWGIILVADTVLYAKKKTHLKPLILTAAVIVCLACYALFIPRFGIMGAAGATLIVYVFYAFLTVRTGERFLRVPYEWKRLAMLVGMCLALYALGRVAVRAAALSPLVVTLATAVAFPVLLSMFGFWLPEERAMFARWRSAVEARIRAYGKGAEPSTLADPRPAAPKGPGSGGGQ